VESFAVVTVGTGVGAGLFQKGALVRGAFGVAGEIGHLPLGDPQARCVCGRHGCVETAAASGAIAAMASQASDAATMGIDQAVQMARQGDNAAKKAFERAGHVLGLAVATLVNLTGPAVVILAGELADATDLFEAPLRRALAGHAFGTAGQARLEVKPHSFHDWAKGAAALVVWTAARQL
jgi:predicted NBD/HSP70 family sugar kinase